MYDLTLLRAFDLDAAKRGEKVCFDDGAELHFVGIDSKGYCVIEAQGLRSQPTSYLRMAPLGWCEGKPVYAGDKLWLNGVQRIANIERDFLEFAWEKQQKRKYLCYETIDGFLIWKRESDATVLSTSVYKRLPAEDKEVMTND